MPASLLDSQLATLEESALDKHAIRIKDVGTPDQIADAIMAALPRR